MKTLNSDYIISAIVIIGTAMCLGAIVGTVVNYKNTTKTCEAHCAPDEFSGSFTKADNKITCYCREKSPLRIISVIK